MTKILESAGTNSELSGSFLEENFANLQSSVKLQQALLLSISRLNPKGLESFTRGNHNGVDLNRNMPASNWKKSEPLSANAKPNPYYSGPKPNSEIENQVLVQILEQVPIDLIVSFHTNHFIDYPNEEQLNYDSNTGKLKNYCQKLSTSSKLPLTESIGYPTPGSLGSYAKENSIECLTVEFEDSLKAEELINRYQDSFGKWLNDQS